MDQRLEGRLADIATACDHLVSKAEEDSSGTVSAPGLFLTNKQALWWGGALVGALVARILDLDEKTIEWIVTLAGGP